MLDQYIKVAYEKSQALEERELTVDVLRKLPNEMLFKLATGQMKLASIDCMDADKSVTWLEQFKDTPLFQKALELEQQNVQLDMLRQQERQQQMAESKERESSRPDFTAVEDQLQLQKKMLSLELASQQLQQAGGAPPGPTPPPMAPPAAQAAPAVGDQGSGAPGPETSAPPKLAAEEPKAPITHRVGEAVGRHYDTIGGALGAVGGAGNALHMMHKAMPGSSPAAKVLGGVAGAAGGYFLGRGMARLGQGAISGMAHAHPHDEQKSSYKPEEKQAAAELVEHAISMGQKLAHADMAKAEKISTVSEVGAILAKEALAAGALGGLAQGAMGFLKSNPGAAIGAGVGALGGLAHGLQKDQQGQRHVLRGVAEGAAGGVAGAAVGHGAQHFAKALGHGGAGIGEALSASGRQVAYQAGKAVDSVKGALSGGVSSMAPTQAAPGGGALGTAKTLLSAGGGVPPTVPGGPAQAAMTQPMSSAGNMMPPAPTVNMLKRPAQMPSRIPTGQITGSAYTS